MRKCLVLWRFQRFCGPSNSFSDSYIFCLVNGITHLIFGLRRFSEVPTLDLSLSLPELAVECLKM